jgi:hypothetical protein
MFILIMIMIGLMVALVGVAVAIGYGSSMKRAHMVDGRYPKGHFLGVGMALGIPLGIPLGLVFGNMALGLPMGIPFGIAIGAALERANSEKIRPLTRGEKRMRNRLLAAITGIIVLGSLSIVALLLIAGV